MPLPAITPALVNSANPWATTLDDLQLLFDCPYTGAITTRTSLLDGFAHDAAQHQYAFFEMRSRDANPRAENVPILANGSLNTLGYSPIALSTYLKMMEQLIARSTLTEEVRLQKCIIISVTGSSEEILESYRHVQALQAKISNPLCMEINLSCPNIPSKPPPAYSRSSLVEYLKSFASETSTPNGKRVAVGLKTPPYTYSDQFKALIDAMLDACDPECPVDFITATNTLGSCLLCSESGVPGISSSSGTGIGGMAGAPLHPLALGNVRTIRSMLDQHERLKHIKIIGVGGVGDRLGYNRMRAVGADVVGVGTALGKDGVGIFEKILNNAIMK